MGEVITVFLLNLPSSTPQRAVLTTIVFLLPFHAAGVLVTVSYRSFIVYSGSHHLTPNGWPERPDLFYS